MPEKNRVIQSLPAKGRARFLSHCELVELVLSETLYEAGAATRYVYFPTRGFVSLVAVIDRDSALEVGMVGAEGMLGIHVALGVDRSPLRALVQGPGDAWRMPVATFRTELSADAGLQRSIDRYVSVLMGQLATSAACVRYHEIQPRLARWLLMSQDRVRSDRFRVTQEFMSFMLGVRRVGVSAAAMALHREGLIDYHRGEVTVIDRPGLEAMACSCYASDRVAEGMLAW